MRIEPAHTVVEKLISSQGRDDDQFRLELTRSTAFKVWLSSDLEGMLVCVIYHYCYVSCLSGTIHVFHTKGDSPLHQLSEWILSKGYSCITGHLRTISCLSGTKVMI
jgi:hypothetical protein